jgi:hypothetical protein
MKYSYYGEYKGGRRATPSGSKKEIRGLAAMISLPGFGTGKEVCITASSGKPTGECFRKGILYKNGKPQKSPFRR